MGHGHPSAAINICGSRPIWLSPVGSVARPNSSAYADMGDPKKKHHAAPAPAARRPTREEREATEMRADVEAYDRAMAEWEAAGRPPGVPLEEIKLRYGIE